MTSALLAAGSAVGRTPCAAGEACVVITVVGDDGDTTTTEFSVSDFDASPHLITHQTYTYRGGPDVNYDAVLPVRDLLNDLGTSPEDVAFVDLGASTSAPRSTLVGDDGDLDDPGPFPSGQLPAIYTANGSDGTRFGYTRGARGSGDSNGADTISTSGDLQLTVHTSGRPLHPAVTATPLTQPTANLPVTFSVDVEDAPGLRYDWAFGDGTTLDDSTDATPTHQYTRTTTSGQDSFAVQVTVTGSDSSTGSSRPVTVTVGSPAPGTGTTPGTGHDDDDDAPATGPDTSEGDTGGEKPSPTSGGTGTGTTGSGTGSGSPAQAPASGEAPQAAEVPELVLPEAVSDGLVAVDGILLGEMDDAGHVIPTAEQQEAAARTAAAARQAAADSSNLPWAAATGGLGLLALIGFGALTETFWLRNRLDRLVRRVVR